MGAKERRNIKATIKNKIKAVLDYFSPDKSDLNDIYGFKVKDNEHLIYDIKNSKINILHYREYILSIRSALALEKARCDYNAKECSSLLQSNSALYKSLAEELENRSKHSLAKTHPLTQKEKEYTKYKGNLDNSIFSLRSAEDNANNLKNELQEAQADLEAQKRRYLAIMNELSARGENIAFYQKEYEDITSNIFARSRKAIIKSKNSLLKKEAAEQEIQK